jgi:hypothetical protein
MTDFPWDISIGIGIVLLGTGAFVVWVLMLDYLETKDATKERQQSEDNRS